MMRVPVLLCAVFLLLSCSVFSPAVSSPPARKPLVDVVIDEFTHDTQVLHSEDYALTQAWWIPVEFWQAALSKVNPALAEQAVQILKSYSMVAVVQADVTALGGFAYYSRDEIAQRLQVQRVGAQGAPVALPQEKSVNPAVQNLLMQLTPLLGKAIGDMGRNMHFFVLADTDDKGQRLASPYETGRVQIQLGASETQPAQQLDIELPVNALFVPRLCANGKPAHVAWKYCPWDGKPL